MIFQEDKPKVDISTETLKLKIAAVDCLLGNGFTWEEIFKATGFREARYNFTKDVLEDRERRS